MAVRMKLWVLDGLAKNNPANPLAYAVKARVLESQGNLAAAKELYGQALKVDPNYDEASNNLAWILAEEGSDLPRALGYAQAARRRYPDNPDVADTLLLLLVVSGDVLAPEHVKTEYTEAQRKPLPTVVD